LARRAAWAASVAARLPFEGRFPFRSQEAIERVQTRHMRRTVAHAYEHVPYFRETMRREGLDPGDFRTAADLAKLPLIEREDLQRDPEYFVSDATPIASCIPLATGGSTGEPVTIFHDPPWALMRALHWERPRQALMKVIGRRFRYSEARIGPNPGSAQRLSEEADRLKPVRTAIRVQRRRFSMLRPPAELIADLNELRADVIASYGSCIEALFSELRASGADFYTPRAVLYGSDPLSEPARRMIVDDFGVPVLSVYSAVEVPQIGFECERHTGLHLSVDLCPVRVVDADGRELPDGESGEIVASNIVGRGTILLNYRLHDLAAKLPGACPCGRTLPLLSFIEGRSVEYLQTPEGRPMHPQAVKLIFRAEREVCRYQVTQTSRSHYRIALVVTPECDREGLRERLAGSFRERIGESVEIDLSCVDSLPRTASGKTRPVVAMAATD
jgi:phenylacetate-CoA ligase